jgi:hypothetical protein
VDRLESVFTRFMERTEEALAEIRASTAEIRASNLPTDALLLEMQRQAEADRRRTVNMVIQVAAIPLEIASREVLRAADAAAQIPRLIVQRGPWLATKMVLYQFTDIRGLRATPRRGGQLGEGR